MSVCLIVLVGLPATGKTTFAKMMLSCDLKSTFNVIHICYDELLAKFGNRPGDYKLNRGYVVEFIQLLINDIHSRRRSNDKKLLNFNETLKYALNVFNVDFCIEINDEINEFVLLIDDNNYYRSMRWELYKLARDNVTGYHQVCFQSTLEGILQRNMDRDTQYVVPEEVIHRMMERIEFPQRKAVKWEENTLFLDIEEEPPLEGEEMMIIIKNRLAQPEIFDETQAIASLVVTQSTLHQIDLILRKEINLRIKTSNQHHYDKTERAKQLNAKRKQLLIDIKRNLVTIPNNLDEIKMFI